MRVDGAVGEARRPPEQSRDGVGHHAGVRSDPELDEARRRRVEVGDGLVGVIDGDRDVVRPAAADAGEQVRFGQERRVRLLLGDVHQLARHRAIVGSNSDRISRSDARLRSAGKRWRSSPVASNRSSASRIVRSASGVKPRDSELRPRQVRLQGELVVLPFGRLGQLRQDAAGSRRRAR